MHAFGSRLDTNFDMGWLRIDLGVKSEHDELLGEATRPCQWSRNIKEYQVDAVILLYDMPKDRGLSAFFFGHDNTPLQTRGWLLGRWPQQWSI